MHFLYRRKKKGQMPEKLVKEVLAVEIKAMLIYVKTFFILLFSLIITTILSD